MGSIGQDWDWILCWEGGWGGCCWAIWPLGGLQYLFYLGQVGDGVMG